MFSAIAPGVLAVNKNGPALLQSYNDFEHITNEKYRERLAEMMRECWTLFGPFSILGAIRESINLIALSFAVFLPFFLSSFCRKEIYIVKI